MGPNLTICTQPIGSLNSKSLLVLDPKVNLSLCNAWFQCEMVKTLKLGAMSSKENIPYWYLDHLTNKWESLHTCIQHKTPKTVQTNSFEMNQPQTCGDKFLCWMDIRGTLICDNSLPPIEPLHFFYHVHNDCVFSFHWMI